MHIENLFPSPLLTFNEVVSKDINLEIIEHLSVLKKLDQRSASQD